MENRISEEIAEVLEAVWTLQEQGEATIEKVADKGRRPSKIQPNIKVLIKGKRLTADLLSKGAYSNCDFLLECQVTTQDRLTL